MPSPSAPTPEILNAEKLNNLGWSANVDLTEGIKRSVKIMSLQIEE